MIHLISPPRPTVRLVGITAALTLVVGLAACSSSPDAAPDGKDSLSVAMITTSAVTTGDWDPATYAAFTKMADKYGFEATNEDSVGYDQAESVLARLAQTNDLVIATSAGYGASALSVAKKYPDTFFVVYAYLEDTEGLPNVAGFSSDWNELGYIAGAVACLSAEGKRIGHVNSEPIPAFTRFAGGIQQAAEEHCVGGAASYLQTYINSFTDVSKAKQAALQLIDQGAEVLIPTIDSAAAGVVEAANDKGSLLVMPYIDQSAVAPKAVVTSWLLNFEAQYDKIGELFSQGKLKAEIYPQNFANGGISLVLPLKNVSDSINKKLQGVVDGLKSGKVKVEDRNLLP